MKKTTYLLSRAVMALLAAHLIGAAQASSHMDAPLITRDPAANTTDVYAFVQNENGIKSLVTALGVYPHEEPGVGPNKYNFDDNVLYQIRVATGNDVSLGKATLSYEFKFDTTFRNQNTILQSYLGVVNDVGDGNQNLIQTYTVTKVDHHQGNHRTVLGTGTVPPNNQGVATPFYNQGNDGNNRAKDGVATEGELDRYTTQTIKNLGGGYSSFAGQRDDGFYGDINAPGNAVFQATLSSGPNAYYFWDGATGLITEIAREGLTFPATLASEMITLNDSNVAAFTAGADTPEGTELSSELDETALYLWTKLGGAAKLIQNGDNIGGQIVSSVNAQHPSFRQRQLNSQGCAAVQYFIAGVTGGATEDRNEGSGPSPYFPGVAPGGQLLVGCAGIVPVSPTPTLPGPTPTATVTPLGGPVGPGPQGVPTLSGGVLALFGIGLAAMALLLIRRRF